MKKRAILPVLAVFAAVLLTACGVRLRSVEELQEEAERRYGGTMVSSHSDREEHAVVMQDADYGFTYTIRSFKGREQIYFDASNTVPAERTECDYDLALMRYVDAQAAEELDAFLEKEHAYRTPGKDFGTYTMHWYITVTDPQSKMRVAAFCNEMLNKYDPKKKLEGKGEISISREDGSLAGYQLFHSKRQQWY